MRFRVPDLMSAGTRLQRVEQLLDQALEDLMGKTASPPCSRCAELLAEAASELQAFGALLTDRPDSHDYSILRPRVQAVLPRLTKAERLLAAAAEFYRGWCAAGPPPSYPTPGYQTDISLHGAALLTVEG